MSPLPRPWFHRRFDRVVGSFGLVGLVVAACGGSPADAERAAPPPVAANPAEIPKAAAPEVADGKTFAEPTAKPPPPPIGATLLEKPALFVQRCTAEHPCPKLLQPAGEAHCRDLELGVYADGWRLPTIDEAKRFAGVAALEELEGFHWTGAAYAEDPKQAWIFDPVGGQSTTVPRDRKPFTIRCVYVP